MIAQQIAPGITRYYLPFSEDQTEWRPHRTYHPEILAYLHTPKSTQQIADHFGMKYNTASSHVARLLGREEIEFTGYVGRSRVKFYRRVG